MGNGSFISFYFIPLFLCTGLWGVLASIADLMKAPVPLPHSSLLLQVTLLKMPPLIRFLLKAVNRIRALVPRHTLLYSSLHSVSPFSMIFPTGVVYLLGSTSEVQVEKERNNRKNNNSCLLSTELQYKTQLAVKLTHLGETHSLSDRKKTERYVEMKKRMF